MLLFRKAAVNMLLPSSADLQDIALNSFLSQTKVPVYRSVLHKETTPCASSSLLTYSNPLPVVIILSEMKAPELYTALRRQLDRTLL